MYCVLKYGGSFIGCSTVHQIHSISQPGRYLPSAAVWTWSLRTTLSSAARKKEILLQLWIGRSILHLDRISLLEGRVGHSQGLSHTIDNDDCGYAVLIIYAHTPPQRSIIKLLYMTMHSHSTAPSRKPCIISDSLRGSSNSYRNGPSHLIFNIWTSLP